MNSELVKLQKKKIEILKGGLSNYAAELHPPPSLPPSFPLLPLSPFLLMSVTHLWRVAIDLLYGVLWGLDEGHLSQALVVDVQDERDELWLGHTRLEGQTTRPGVTHVWLRESEEVSVQGDG